MPVKDLNIIYKDKKIRVRNTWFSGAELFIDGGCKDATDQLFALNKNRPILSTSIETNRGKDIIEVFMHAILTVKIKIFVDGKFIAGENF